MMAIKNNHRCCDCNFLGRLRGGEGGMKQVGPMDKDEKEHEKKKECIQTHCTLIHVAEDTQRRPQDNNKDGERQVYLPVHPWNYHNCKHFSKENN